MNDGWWLMPIKNKIKNEKTNLKKKEGKNYELWRIWWDVCTTTIKK